jgi:squalene monooxygenase
MDFHTQATSISGYTELVAPFILPTILTFLYLIYIIIHERKNRTTTATITKEKDEESTRRDSVKNQVTITRTNKTKNGNNNNNNNNYDVCVIGAGIVGTTLATALAQQGKTVLVIERDLSEPDRIVGELLQPGGVRRLQQLGFAHCLENIDSPKIKGYGVFYNGERVHLPYPKDHSRQEDSERPTGRSFHYGRFVMNLRRTACEQPTLKMVQGTVNKLLENHDNVVTGVSYVDTTTNVTHTVSAALTIVANGAGSSLTKQLNDSKPIIASHFVGLKLHDAAHHLPFTWHGNVFMVEPAPILCYPISSTDVRVLIDFPDKIPNMEDGSMQRFLIEKVCPSLPEGLQDAFIKCVSSGNVKCAQNREMPADVQFKKKGAIMLGDALNTRHPLTGGGMTVGLGDVVTLRDLLKDVQDLTDHEAIDQAMMILAKKRKKYASTINILANALYAIFAPGAKDPMRSYMRQATFNYFKLGGICATGPVGLLAGLTQSYYILLTHFFSVAIVGCFYQCFPIPSPAAIWRSFKLLKSATDIVGPLIAEEKCLPYLFPKSLFKRL